MNLKTAISLIWVVLRDCFENLDYLVFDSRQNSSFFSEGFVLFFLFDKKIIRLFCIIYVLCHLF